MNAQNLTLTAPLDGVLLSLESSADPVFAQKLVGDGVVIEPSGDTLLAPCDGVVSQLHDAGHAVAIKANDSVEVLMHIGIDTVTLKGLGFEPQVTIGQAVVKGQPLIEFNKAIIEENGLNAQTVVLLTSGQSVPSLQVSKTIHANVDELFTISGSENSEKDNVPVQAVTGDPIQLTVEIPNPQGLHARPAAQLVAVAKQFASQITLTHNAKGASSSAHSVTGILGLQTQLGSELTIQAQGQDAQQAVDAIEQAIRAGLGEQIQTISNNEEDAFPIEAPLLGNQESNKYHLQGIKAAPGIALGELNFRNKEIPSYPEQGVGVDDELGQLSYALTEAKKQLSQLINTLENKNLTEQSGVFKAHLALLEDPALTENTQADIKKGYSAAAAWQTSYQTESKQLAEMDNALLKARASDIDDVGYRVLCLLLGIEDHASDVADNTILVMDDITPSEVVALDLDKVVGLVTLEGGSTSHAAIIAGSLNLPYVVNVSNAIRKVQPGSTVILDANQGTLLLQPNEQTLQQFTKDQAQLKEQRAAAQARALEPAVTKDGVTIEVAANIGSVQDAIKAANSGADGVGLVRSEFLYLDRATEPSLAEQTESYQRILEAVGTKHACIIRTLDVGGDKPLSYLPLPKEENPFLGERGIRVGLNRPHMLRKQIRAILAAAKTGKPRIMFPMIASIDEFRAAKQLVLEEQQRAGVADIELGIMIEVPSAALMADQFAKEVDFFSIGTNDLTQYTLAMDRGHPKLTAQVDALHPAVLRLIAQTAQASNTAEKWTGICGSIASDVSAVPILIGLGVTELSANIPSIALVKQKVRSLNLAECKALAQQALQCSSPEAVRALLK